MTSIDPKHTAVVAVHLQNDIVGPEGAFAPFFRPEIERTGVLDVIARLLEGARSAGASAVYTRCLAARLPRPARELTAAAHRHPEQNACRTAARAPRSSTNSHPRTATS